MSADTVVVICGSSQHASNVVLCVVPPDQEDLAFATLALRDLLDEGFCEAEVQFQEYLSPDEVMDPVAVRNAYETAMSEELGPGGLPSRQLRLETLRVSFVNWERRRQEFETQAQRVLGRMVQK